MRVVKITTVAALALNLVVGPMNISAHEITNSQGEVTVEDLHSLAKTATVSEFSLQRNALLNEYNKAFRMDAANILSLTNNGGNYAGSPLKSAIDGNFSTHWETNKPNSSTFTNELIFNFGETVSLNRIVYAARQSSAKGKGFATEFEIYSSESDEGNDFTHVSSGAYSGSSGDIVAIQFDPTEFKRLKFVFNKANQSWASASEIQFYKEDRLTEKMARLFTDNTLSVLNEEFSTLEALNKLEEEATNHPLYVQFQEDIDNAKLLLKQQEIEFTTAVTKSFTDYANEEYSKLFRVDSAKIKNIRNNAGNYSNAVIGNAIDGNVDTYWETNRGNTNDFTNEVEIEFHEALELNRIIYGARSSDRKGFAETFEIYASQTSKGETFELVATGQHPTIAGLVEAKFEPTLFKRVKFKFKKSNQNWATLSEISFYTKDDVEEQVNNLFTNGLMNELKEEFNSLSVINEIEQAIAQHPLRERFQVSLNLAKDLVNNVVVSNEAIITASQRGNANKQASKYQVARTSFSLDTFGRYVVPGETIQLFVDTDKNGVMPTLVLGQIADDLNGWSRKYTLQPGLNTFTAPAYSTMKPAVIYIENGALPTEQAYAPRVRLVGGTAFPVYYHGKTDPVAFEKELEEYVAKISIDDGDFANGIPDNVVYNIAELISENNTISTTAAGALKGVQEMKSINKTVSDTMDEWEIMWNEFQKLSGNFELSLDPNEFFTAKFTSRVFTKGPYGWSDWGYTGYNGGNTPRRDSGFFKQIVKPFSAPGNDSWAYYHEWGHNINNAAMEHGEVTNNLHSVIMRKIFEKSDSDRVDWNGLYKRFAGETVSHGYWTYLGILEQIQYYYGEDSYALATQISIKNSNGVMNGLSSNLQRLVIGMSLATETDLTEFFQDWGYVTATDVMRGKVAHLPKPAVKLEYMNSLGRHYEGAGFTKDANVTIHSLKADSDMSQITLRYDIDSANKDASMGYEIKRDGKVVGYTTSTSFIDKNVDVSKAYQYEIVAYDRKLNSINPAEVISQQPNLSVEEYVTLKLHQDFDPMAYVKASSYLGNDITTDVVIKSNNVDITKKGNYEIVYEVKYGEIAVNKTSTINVTSDYTYISDMDAKLAKIAYGGLKKDLAPSGNAITLSRQGIAATYSKGIGAHANSEVTYDIEGKNFDMFESYIGIDQAMNGRASSATFEIWVDGEKKFGSDVFGSLTEHEFVKVPVTGAKEVKLITTDANNNGNSYDHTVWADAKFIKDSSKPVLTVKNQLEFVKLNSEFDLMDGVEASDTEDGNLIGEVTVNENNFSVNQTGTYTVTYTVSDSDGFTVSTSKEIYVYSDTTFASDIEWESAQTAWRTVNKDRASLGESIKVVVKGEVKEFAKGIGTHANSEIVYDLEGKNYDYFETLVGVDQNIAVNNVSSVTFKILADGQEIFNSGVMNYKTEAKLVKIPVKGVKKLTLIANDSGNSNASDHASFADAKFYISDGLPQLSIPKSVATKVGTPIDINEEYTAFDAEDGNLTAEVQVTGADLVDFDRAGTYELTYTVTDRAGNEVTAKRTITVVDMDAEDTQYLSNLDWKSTQNSYTAPRKDVSISAKALRLTAEDGSVITYEKGIGAHSNSTIVYDLTGIDAHYFSSFVGVDRQMYGTVGSVIFQVFIDGEKQFDSGLMQSQNPQKYVELNISGAKELKLVVTDGGNGNGSDHGVWGDAKLYLAN